MRPATPITEDLLAQFLEAFEVDPTSPSGLRWRVPTGCRVKCGDVAGRLLNTNTWEVYFNGKPYKNHRIVYAMANNVNPNDLEIDHIDGNRSNNHPNNLRLATRKQNQRNQVNRRADNTSGISGVCWFKERQKWRARIFVDGKYLHLGCFVCKEQATKVRREAELKYFGEFAPIRKQS
jgi:hypothetical protein